MNDLFVTLMQFNWVDYSDRNEAFLYVNKSNGFLRLKNRSVSQS